MQDLSFPIGHFKGAGIFDAENVESLIRRIEAYPQKLEALVSGMSQAQLDTPYRPDGWTVRQVVHHTADSHLHAYLRFKKVLTEDNPTILPYDQAAWANLSDSISGEIAPPIKMLKALHQRWVNLLRGLSLEDLSRVYTHPEHSGTQPLFFMLCLYAWHCDHHYAHIQDLVDREQWHF